MSQTERPYMTKLVAEMSDGSSFDFESFTADGQQTTSFDEVSDWVAAYLKAGGTGRLDVTIEPVE